MSPTLVPTSLGPARIWLHPATGAPATLVLGHGAGRGADTADLLALAGWLPERGVAVVRVDQPWVVAGRRVAPPPATLDRAWSEIVPGLEIEGGLLLGGRSAGARVACRTATALGAQGVLALAFPLHPPGRPDRSRAGELAEASRLLVVQGERDAFGRPAEFAAAHRLLTVPGADHALARGLPPEVLERVLAWGIAAATAGVP